MQDIQIALCDLAGNADAKPEDINWERVVENWTLPFKKAKKTSRKAKNGK